MNNKILLNEKNDRNYKEDSFPLGCVVYRHVNTEQLQLNLFNEQDTTVLRSYANM